MTDLLDEVLAAHGGLDRWNELQTVSARLIQGGAEGMAPVTTTKASSITYTALCEREGRWWVITVPELSSGGVTQAHTLDEVPVVVADLVATMTGADRASVEVNMRVHAGPELSKPSALAALATVASSLVRRLSRAA